MLGCLPGRWLLAGIDPKAAPAAATGLLAGAFVTASDGRTLPLPTLERHGHLREADVVAEGVAQAAVDAVAAVGRPLGELHALGEQLLVSLAAVVGCEE